MVSATERSKIHGKTHAEHVTGVHSGATAIAATSSFTKRPASKSGNTTKSSAARAVEGMLSNRVVLTMTPKAVEVMEAATIVAATGCTRVRKWSRSVVAVAGALEVTECCMVVWEQRQVWRPAQG